MFLNPPKFHHEHQCVSTWSSGMFADGAKIMTEDQREWLFEVVEHARRGNQRAIYALLLILETERKATIIAALISGDVRWQDVADAHHDVVVRVGERIEQLRATRAYFKWESRIINEVCKKYRRGYRLLAELSETALSQLGGQTQFMGALDEELY
jgi:hypothetical protein